MNAPLADITVVEIDSWMAAPSAGAILSDLGARVIKVEPLEGDPMRGISRKPKLDDDPARLYDYQFDVDNRGKESILVDLQSERGIGLIHLLCRSAQIFMCNLLPNRQQKFQLDMKALLAINPKLVHATLTGYGSDGPEAWRPGYDVTAFFGRSGLYDAMKEGSAGVVPNARPAQGDHTTGLAFSTAILAALRLAEQSGQGQTVETSLFETAVWTQASDYATTAVDHAPVRQRAREELLSPMMNRYPCGDGKWVVFNMPGDNGWSKFCSALDLEDCLDDPRFADGRTRYDHMDTLVPMIDEALSRRSRDEWGPIFDESGLIWGPVLGLHEVPADPQAKAIGLFPTIESTDIGHYRSVRIPMRFGRGIDVGPKAPAPSPGADTRALLSELGHDAAAIDDLFDEDVVG